MLEDSREQRRRSGRAEAARLNAEFDLGKVLRVARARDYRPLAAWGALLAFVAVIFGVPIAAGIAGGARTAAPKEVADEVVGGLLLLGCLMFGIGAPLSPVERRLFWYSGGVAQIVRDRPGPQVVRWADVETVTMTFRYDDEAAPTLSGCMLRGSTGTELTDLGRYRKSLLRDLLVTADHTLAPRFVPPLIEAYESGEPVTVGDARIDEAGIVDSGDGRIPWDEIGSISMVHVPHSDDTAPICQVYVRRPPRKRSAKGIVAVIDLSNAPNGIFGPYLVAYAVRQHGIQVDGFIRGIPRPAALSESAPSSSPAEADY